MEKNSLTSMADKGQRKNLVAVRKPKYDNFSEYGFFLKRVKFFTFPQLKRRTLLVAKLENL